MSGFFESLRRAAYSLSLRGILAACVVRAALFAAPVLGDDTTPSTESSDKPVVKNVHYELTVESRRLKIVADVSLRQAKSKQTRLFLPLGTLSLESAELDGQPAAVRRARRDVTGVELLQEAAGDSRLRLAMSTPLLPAGTDRIATLPLIPNTAATIRVQVPAGQSLLVDGRELQRPKPNGEPAVYEFAAGNRRRLTLRLTDGKSSRQTDPLLLATSRADLAVSAGLVHWTSETQLQISGRSVQELTLSVPGRLHATAVESLDVVDWSQTEPADGETRNAVRVRFRQPFSGTRTIRLQGEMSLGSEPFWKVPNLVVTGADSHAGHIAVRFPSQDRIRVDEFAGLQQSGAALDRSPVTFIPVTTGDRTKHVARRQLAFDFWRQDYELVLVVPKNHRADTADAMTRLAVHRDHVVLSFHAATRFRHRPNRLRFSLPAGWTLQAVQIDGRDADWSQRPVEADVQHVSVVVPAMNSANDNGNRSSAVRMAVQAVRHLEIPDAPNAAAELPIPELHLTDTRMQLGTVTVRTAEPVELHADDLKGLKPTPPKNADDQLAFRYVVRGNDRPAITGTLAIRPRPAALSVRSRSRLQLDPFRQTSHHELTLSPQGVGYESLDIRVPASTGDHAMFRLVGTRAKLRAAVPQKPKGEFRTWTLQFDRPLRETATVIVSLDSPRPEQATAAVTGHRVQVVQAAGHTGVIGIEADDNRQLHITTVDHAGGQGKKQAAAPEKKQELEEITTEEFDTAINRSSRRLMAAYRFLAPEYAITLTETALPTLNAATVVCRQQTLESILSAAGGIQNRITLDLEAVGVRDIRVQLPEQAVLWAVLRDGRPIELRRVGEAIVIPLELSAQTSQRRIELIYQTRTDALENLGRLRQTAPTATFLSPDGRVVPVEIREREWTLYHPDDVALLKSTGEFQSANRLDEASWLTAAFAPTTGPGGFTLLEKLGLLVGLLAVVALMGLSFRRFGPAGAFGVLSVLAVFGMALFIFPAVQSARESASIPTSSMAGTSAKSEATKSASYQDERAGDANITASREPAKEPAPSKTPSSKTPGKSVPKPLDEMTEGKKETVAESPVAKLARASRARLSVAVAFTPPPHAEIKQFRYVGAETESPIALDLTYENRRGGLMLRCCLLVGVSLLFWWFRHRSVTFRGRLAFLGIVVPAVLVGWATPIWQPSLDGVFIGTLAGSALWGLRHFGIHLAKQIRDRRAAVSPEWLAKRTTVGLVIVACLWGTENESVIAADRPAANTESAPEQITQSDGFVSSATYEITLQADSKTSQKTAVVKARYTVHNLRSGAAAVAVPLGRAAIATGTLDGKPASLFWRSTSIPKIKPEAVEHLTILVPTAGRHELQIQFTIPLTKSATGSAFTLPVRPVASGRIILRRPTDGDRITITGSHEAIQETQQAGQTILEIPADRSRDITFQLQAPGSRAAVIATVAIEAATTDIDITDLGVRQQDRFSLLVRNGTVSEWTFRLPAERKLMAIAGPDVVGWTLTDAKDGERLARVQFQKPIAKTTEITFELMQPQSFTEEPTDLTIRRITPENLSSANTTVSLSAGRQFDVRLQSARQARRLEPGKTDQTERTPRFRYRLTQPDAELTFRVNRRQSRTEIAAEHAVVVDRDEIRIASRLTADLMGFPRTKLTLFLPEGFTLQDVRGDHGAEWSLGEDETMLIVQFPKPQSGVVRISLQGFLRRDAKSATADIALPAPMMVHKLDTVVGLWGSAGLAVTPKNGGGWKLLGAADIPAVVRNRVTGPSVAGFRSSQLEPALLSVAVSPQPAEIRAAALTFITVTDSAVHYTTLMKCTGLTGLSRRVAINGPAWLGESVAWKCGSSARIQKSAGNNAPQGQTRWIISDADRRNREMVAMATATVPITPANAHRLTAPVYRFEQIDTDADGNDGQPAVFKPVSHTQQFVVVVNHSNSRIVKPAAARHRTIAGRELSADWTLPAAWTDELTAHAVDRVVVNDNAGEPSWAVRRTVKRLGVSAAVNRAELTTLLEADGTWRLRAVYRMKNYNRRFLAVTLPDGARLNHVSVAGRAVRVALRKHESGVWHLIPLVRSRANDEAFDVQVVLSGKRTDGALPRSLQLAATRLDLPAPRVVSLEDNAAWGIPVEQTLWRVRLPAGFHAATDTDRDATNVTPDTTAAMRAVADSGATGTETPSRILDDAALQRLLQNRADELFRGNTNATSSSARQPTFAFPLHAEGVIGGAEGPLQRTSFRTMGDEGNPTAAENRRAANRSRTVRPEDPDAATIEFDLPDADSGTVLTFRKAGGDPRLVLNLRPETMTQSGWQFAWAAGWVLFGVIGWRTLRREDAAQQLLRLLPFALFAFGVLTFLSLAGPLSACGLMVALIGSGWIAIGLCRGRAVLPG